MVEEQIPNYVKEMSRLSDTGVLKCGEFLMVDVAHDDWCDIYKGEPCNCEPDIINRETGEVLNRK